MTNLGKETGLCALLGILVFLAFGRVIHHDFINLDDNMYVYENAHVTGGLTWAGAAWAFTQGYAANWHPLTWLSHMLDCQLFGLQPGWHHLTNLLLHAATAVLLFLVLNRMTASIWPSAFAAALFALHPLRVESVAWVAERKDVLSGLFFVLTLAAYLHYTRSRSWRRYLPVAFFFALGLMSKPMLVTLPFVLLLLDYWPLKRFEFRSCRCGNTSPPQKNAGNALPSIFSGICKRAAGSSRPPCPAATLPLLILEKIPLLLLVAASSLVTLWAQAQVGAIKSGADLSLPWRMGNAAVSCVIYIGQMFFPVNLAAYYPHLGTRLPLMQIIGACLTLAVISTVAILLGRRRPYLPVGWFWYLGMLVPVIGLVQVGAQAHADRYTYLPQIGLCLIIAWGAADLTRTWARRRLILSVSAGLALAALAWGSWWQTACWQNSETLWRHVLDCTQNNGFTEKLYGDYLRDRGRLDEAILHYRRGIAMTPGLAGLRMNCGNALYRKNQLAEAQTELEAALQIDPDYLEAHISLGVVLFLQKQIPEAVGHLQFVITHDPFNPAANNDLGIVLDGQGRTEESMEHYRRALEKNPGFTDARRNLARLLHRTGRTAEAIPQYQLVLKAVPGDVAVRGNLAGALAQAGRFAEASAELEQALALLGPEQESLAQTFRERLKSYQAGQTESSGPP